MAYLPKLNPTVGGGLGGLPERRKGILSSSMSNKVGDIVFSEKKPDDNWLEANGYGVEVNKYSELFKAYGGNLEQYIESEVIQDIYIADAGNYVTGVSFTADGIYLAITISVSPYIVILKRTGDTFTRLPNLSVLPSSIANNCSFSKDGSYLLVVNNGTSPILFYKRVGDIFTRMSVSTTMVRGYGCQISPDNRYVIVAHISTENEIHRINENGSLTKVTSITLSNSGYNMGACFSPNSDMVVIGKRDSNFMSVFKENGATFSEIQISVRPNGQVHAVEFSPDGKYLAVGYSGGKYLSIYEKSGTVLTLLPDIDTTIGATVAGVSWSGDGKYLTAISSDTKKIHTYEVDNGSFTKVPNFNMLPTASPRDCSYGLDSNYLAVGQSNSNGLSVYLRPFSNPIKIYIPDLQQAKSVMENVYTPAVPKTAYIKAK